MEVGAGVRKADRCAVLLHVGQDQDVGVLGMVELVDHVRLGPAELARELEELRRLQLQISEDQDLPGKERIPDFPEIRADRVSLQPETAELRQAHPCTARSCFMRAQASGGADSRPATSASPDSSPKSSRGRAHRWPPPLTKSARWPLSHA